MNRGIIAVLAITALAVGGCKSKPKTEAPPVRIIDIPAGTGKKGKVTKTMNQAGYTYVEVTDEAGQKVWLASPEMKIEEGDRIEYPETKPMLNFTSKTLKKTFDKIYFVPGIKFEKQ